MSTPTEKYVTRWDKATSPHWVTRLENGIYQSYHYTQEAADRNTAHLNELVKLRAENAALRDTIEELRHENIGLLADKERLDWMNSHGYNEKEIKWINDFRAAIDAARAKEAKP